MASHIIARHLALVIFIWASVNFVYASVKYFLNNSGAEFFMLAAIFWALISILLTIEGGKK